MAKWDYNDAYALMNSLVQQSGGVTDLTAVDTSSFVAVGTSLLYGDRTDRLFGTITQMITKTIFANRKYESERFRSIENTSDQFGAYTRKISYLYDDLTPTSFLNTDINASQLADGNTIDMYKIKKPKPYEANFVNTSVLQDYITRFEEPNLRNAFTDESSFLTFWSGAMQEFENQIEQSLEMTREATVLNAIATNYYYAINSINSNMAVDLVAGYNGEYGTTYTRDELLTTYAESFAQYVAATIKKYSRFMRDRSVLYHVSPSTFGEDGYIFRQTPANDLKMIMYEPLFIDTQARVYSNIFNPQYLQIGDFEGVTHWQAGNDRSAVNVYPTMLFSGTMTQTITSDSGTVIETYSQTGTRTNRSTIDVNIDYVVGILFDRQAMGVNAQWTGSSATPFNSAGRYTNMYWYALRNMWNDPTENSVVFYLGE